MVNLGIDIKYVAFSYCKESVPKGFPEDKIKLECENVTSKLGLEKQNVNILDFKVRYFPKYRQKILEYLIKLRSSYNPDIIFIPSSQDIHQDHNTIYNEGFRAFKNSTILGYEQPQNLKKSIHSVYIKLSDEILSKKIEILSSYESQNFRSYLSNESLRSLAKVRGIECGSEYAEAFENIRLIIN